MGTIKTIKKWSLEDNSWHEAKTQDDRKKAFSIASYGDIIHREGEPLNIILIADGHRVENCSKDARTIKERKAGITNIISYFEKKEENYRIELLFVDNDAPLREESVSFAHYIDYLAALSDVKTINYLGLSKCGLIGLDMIKYLRNTRSLFKTRIYSVSSPYEGTIMASPKALIIEIRKIIEAKLGRNEFSAKVISAIEKTYFGKLSNSHMDLDIAIPGGVPDEMMDCYDPKFLEEIFCSENLKSAKIVSHYQNICTRIDDGTLKEALKAGDLVSLGLCILNDILFNGNSDGIVSYSSQSAIESHLDSHEKSLIVSSTHNSLIVPKVAQRILDAVDDNMREKHL